MKWADTSRTNYFSSRMSYTAQLLIARKFSNAFSLQLTPTYVHKNLVELRTDQNDIFSIGIGGRYKVSQRTSLNAEYFYLLPGTTADNYENCLSLGVFQIRLTNAQPMVEPGFITETSDKWLDGGIFLGFTINRVFTVVKSSVPEN
jgi:predicted porin